MMFDSSVFNLTIGLLFIFLLYSLLATIIQEIIAANFNLRGFALKKSIEKMLDGNSAQKELSKLFYNHPLIKGLASGFIHKKPSYLSGDNFSKVVVDLLRGKDAKAGENFAPAIQKSLDDLKAQWSPAKMGESTNNLLKSFWADSQGDVEKFKALLEKWFDDTMEHTSGVYKRKTQFFLFIIGLFIAVIFNIEAIQIAKKLSGNPALAKQLADNASVYLETHKELGTKVQPQTNPIFITGDSLGLKVSTDRNRLINEPMFYSLKDTSFLRIEVTKDSNQRSIDSIQLTLIEKSTRLIDSVNTILHTDISNTNELLGLGWNCRNTNREFLLCFKENFAWKSVLGWIITALAISMGAPFWFDLLTRFMKLRGSSLRPNDRSGIRTSDNNSDRVG